MWYMGFSLRWLLLLWSTDSRHIGLVAPWQVVSSRTRDQTHVPCAGRQISIQCTARDVHIPALHPDFIVPGS